jgi:hypothetical protein
MEEAPENGKELSHSAHANGIEYNCFGRLQIGARVTTSIFSPQDEEL